MPANKPVGPHPFLIGCTIVGLILVGLGVFRPSLHTIWEVPLGAFMIISSMGKMVSR